ncbi:hypothetical protein BDL97_03G088800 [Sphagnum fallax]|nr:hypothetical protein BDL97_03G088800 [Sphagnum fallax]
MIGSPMPVFLSKDATIEGSCGCVKVKPDVEVKTMQQLDLHSLGFDPSCSFSKHLESRHCMFNKMCIIRCFDLDYWILGNRWLLLLQALAAQMSRIAVLAAVYDYWKSKQDHWQKPFLHCLQPPPPVNDTNPFNVFRPREKTHRPQPNSLPESGTSKRNSMYHATGVYDFCNSLSWDLSFP